jgi:hypothetical protein
MEIGSNTYTQRVSTLIKKQNNTKTPTGFAGRSPSFGGLTSNAMRIPAYYKTFYKLKHSGGEIESVILNGLGKVLIAPLVIAFNPFSDENKETKTYSAWKQPIEGLAAIAAQLTVNIQANKFIDKIAKSGELKKFDISENALNTITREQQKLKFKSLNIFKARVGFALALISIPLTCSFVSWVFPKFMKTAFPELSGMKKEEDD